MDKARKLFRLPNEHFTFRVMDLDGNILHEAEVSIHSEKFGYEYATFETAKIPDLRGGDIFVFADPVILRSTRV